MAFLSSAYPLNQGCKHAVEHSPSATKNLECANVFSLHFILYAYECYMAKLICVRY